MPLDVRKFKCVNPDGLGAESFIVRKSTSLPAIFTTRIHASQWRVWQALERALHTSTMQRRTIVTPLMYYHLTPLFEIWNRLTLLVSAIIARV